MKTPTEGAAMNPTTPKTELPPSTQLRKAVFGGSRVIHKIQIQFSFSKLFLVLTWLLAFAKNVHSQEALRLSLAGESVTEALHQAENTSGFYNLLLGPTAWRFLAGLSADYNDNVRLQQQNHEGDFIFRPNFKTQMQWPVTEKNSLDFSLGIGYLDYLQHRDLNQLYINPGSGISFDIYIGDFAINLHDRVSVTQNTYENPAANGNGIKARLENTTGTSVAWDLNKAVVTAGYDHANYMPLGSSQPQPADAASENLYINGGLRLRPEILMGVEAGGGLISYGQSSSAVSPNAMQWNAGGFGRIQISE